MGIDFGTKRIGLAIGDDQIGIASPLQMIPVTKTIQDQLVSIIQLAEEYQIDAFVIGLPTNMDDSEGPQAKLTRHFGDELSCSSDKKIHYFDERLSSYAADELLQQSDLTRKQKKSLQDAIAAQVILQGFLDSQT